MRKSYGVLTVLVVSGSLLSASLADEKADVALVEQEIRAVDDSIAIHNRAKERARKAVDRSSLGQKCRNAISKWKKADKALRTSRAKTDERTKAEYLAELHRRRATLYEKKCYLFVKRMTRIFLSDEIERAQEKKLPGLARELKKIRKDYAHI